MTNDTVAIDNNEITLKGIITHIISERLKGCICYLDVIDTNKISKIKIKIANTLLMAKPSTGEIWEIRGKIETSRTYGAQLIAIDCSRQRPSGSILIQFLSLNNRFAGIGDKKAKRLWAIFGQDLYKILDDANIAALTDKKKGKLSERLAENLVDVWSNYEEETPIIEWLHRHGFKPSLATKVRNFWGSDVISKINANPYRLLAFESWSKVDKLALSLGISNTDIKRQIAAMEATLYAHYDKGNTAVTETDLQKGIKNKIKSKINYPNLFHTALKNRVIVRNNDKYQSLGAYSLEEIIKKRILSSIKEKDIQHLPSSSPFSEIKLNTFEKNKGFLLNPEQKLAIKMVLENNVSCIKGGAGVGKTTVLDAIYDQIEANISIYQVALTGRAAKRMMEATNHDAKTIAAFLIETKKNQIQNNSYIFIDESSMLDIPTVYRLFKVLPKSTQICFIGDQHQLPPIGPGLVFNKITESNKIPQIELIQPHRFSNESEIPNIAEQVRTQSSNITLDNFSGIKNKDYGVSFIDANDSSTLIDSTIPIFREFDHYGEVQILAPTNAICTQINTLLHNEHINTRQFQKLPTPLTPVKGKMITIGDPLLHHNRNDYSKQLYNGSLGILTNIYDTSLKSIDDMGNEIEFIAEANFDNGNIVKLTEFDFNYISLGYCVTTHKSQGSQFERAIIICPNTRLIDNAWLYTAVTRARKQVCIIGNRATFLDECASKPRAFNRCVGLEL